MKEEIARNREMSLTPLVLESRGARARCRNRGVDKTVVCPLLLMIYRAILDSEQERVKWY